MELKVNLDRANKGLREAWDIFASGDSKKAYKKIHRIFFPGGINLDKYYFDELVWLQTYEYPELKEIQNKVKREFSLVASWNIFLNSFPGDLWWAKKENLAPLLGVSYNLDLDIRAARKVLGYSELVPFSTMDQQRYRHWPELSTFSNFSLIARSLFIRVIKYAQVRSGGLSDSRKVGQLELQETKEALHDLSEAGLISTNLFASDLLMAKPLNELKKFAFENGIVLYGAKYQVVQGIVAGVKENRIMQWLKKAGPVDFVRPAIKDFQLLKQHVWADSSLIDLYLEWIRQTKYLKKSEQGIIMDREQKLERSRYNPLAPWRPSLGTNDRRVTNRIWKSEKMNLLRELWDINLDKVLSEVVGKYAWDWDMYIEQSMRDYLSPEKVKVFKKACKNNLHLYRFCEQRLIELGIEIRKPSLLICAGCGIQFMNWSVDPRLAERVGYRIHFCQNCYYKAGGGSDNSLINKDTMLEQLSKVANIMSIVPTSSFRRSLNLASISEENQIVLIKTLLAMPPFEKFVEKFGSWLQALILAGVLEGGTQRTSRGIRCIANDGHLCGSLAEKTIDDWLTARNISHAKEPHYPYHSRFNTSNMRADWKVKDMLIEYAGLMDEPTYAAKMKAKQELAKEIGISLIIIEPKDILDLNDKLERITLTS